MPARGAHRGAHLAVALAVPAAGVLFAACGSGRPSAARPTGQTRRTSPVATASTTATTTTVAASTTIPPTTIATTGTTSAPAGQLACSSGILALREGGLSAAAGTSHVTYLLTNEGSKGCTLRGYPTVALFGTSGAGGAGAGAQLPVRPIELGGATGGVTVPAGGSASFVLSVAEVPVDGSGCQQAGSLQVTPPGAGAALSVPAGFTVCGTTVGVYPLTSGR